MGFLTSRYTKFRKWLKGRKLRGQWYIIAAVLFSYSLIIFFDIFSSYSQIDYTSIAQRDEDVLFYNVLNDLERISNVSSSETVEQDIEDYMEMVRPHILEGGGFISYNVSMVGGELVLEHIEISGENIRSRIPSQMACPDECAGVYSGVCSGDQNTSCGYFGGMKCLKLSVDNCSDCSCSCGDFGKINETGFCMDGKDNDCDGSTDNGDLDCIWSPVGGTCNTTTRVYCDPMGSCTLPDSAEYCLNCDYCIDSFQNCDETGTDCGGAECPSCTACTPGTCNTTTRSYCNSTGFWTAPDSAEYCSNCLHCTDSSQNCGETGVNCGSDCPACSVCTPGTCNTTSRRYCNASGFWNPVDDPLYCSSCLHCTDGSQNCGETGVNCGGTDCPACTAPFQITDTFLDETKIALKQNVTVNTTLGNVVLERGGPCGAGHTDNGATCTARLNNPTEDGNVEDDDGHYYIDSTDHQMGSGHDHDGENDDFRSYVEWDISSIPDSSIITNTVFWCHGEDYETDLQIRAMSSRPSTSSARTVFDDAGDGAIYAAPSGFPRESDNTVDLGATADSDLQSMLPSNWFAIGIQEVDEWNHDSDIYTEDAGGLNPTLTVTYLKPYKPSGLLGSTNLLSGSVSSIDSFGYSTTIPAGTSIKVQFSLDNIVWRNSAGAVNGWDTLSSGTGTISLASLGWSGSSFYYRAQFTTSSASTPTLNEISLSGAL